MQSAGAGPNTGMAAAGAAAAQQGLGDGGLAAPLWQALALRKPVLLVVNKVGGGC